MSNAKWKNHESAKQQCALLSTISTDAEELLVVDWDVEVYLIVCFLA